ncbi:MAG TPA: cytochrome c maturation protein CcmE [Poseidonia sp.]|nr:cytochrome c maturation protein CcmE [Poseidonia sp.]
MWSRRTRIMVVGAVITLGLLATVLVQAPVPTRTVDEIMEDPDVHVGEEIAVRGEVLDGSIDNGTMTFILEGESSTLEIRYTDAAVSNGLGDNRTVYAEGILLLEGDTYVLDASTIKTSCPSKYEEEADSE